MNAVDRQYLDLLRDIMENGNVRDDRTGTGTRGVFGRQLRFDLADGFPLLTTKRVHFRSIRAELLWMISGSTNVKDLQAMGCSIWDEWADESGNLGPVYGHQWRSVYNPDWAEDAPGAFDQLAMAIEEIRTNPFSRRIIVDSWNVSDLPFMALPPCHMLFQFYVADGRLSTSMYQRSADVFLGLPFNIAQYALLTHLVAKVTNLKPGELIISLGDAHLYSNHLEQARIQLGREPRELPKIYLNGRKEIDDFRMEDIVLVGYNPHPSIKAEVSV